MTGPPGAGKSTLLSALVAHWRERRAHASPCWRSTPHPSARAARCSATARGSSTTPRDDGILIRSTAAAGGSGGLAAATREAAEALAAAFDLVVVETVGVGQSETEVEEVCDTVAVVVQPGSGDVLQFLKAGIMEVPDVLVVTKADLGEAALRAQRDLRAALSALGSRECRWCRCRRSPRRRGSRSSWRRSRPTERAWTSASAGCARAAWRALRELVDEHGERALRSAGGPPRGRAPPERPAPRRVRVQSAAGPGDKGMSRRKRADELPPPPPHAARTGGLLAQTAILVAVLAVVTLIAEAAGAANLGVAISIGSIAFTIVLMYFILRR